MACNIQPEREEGEPTTREEEEPTTRKEGEPTTATFIQLYVAFICEKCQATAWVDNRYFVLFCPYCGYNGKEEDPDVIRT